MARQPEKQIPFRPFAQGVRSGAAIVSTDDRRALYKGLPPLNQAQEIEVRGSGSIQWVDVLNDPIPSNLVEVYRLALPRPEPITLSFAIRAVPTDRFEYPYGHYAEILPQPNPQINTRGGRMFVEWGHGQFKQWTYFDLSQGSFSLPSASFVKVSAWIKGSGVFGYVSTHANIGYYDPNAYMPWTFVVATNVAGVTYNKPVPRLAKDVTFSYYSPNAGDIGLFDIGDGSDRIHRSVFLAPIPGNAPVNPQPTWHMPITGGGTSIFMEANVLAAGFARLVAICRVKV